MNTSKSGRFTATKCIEQLANFFKSISCGINIGMGNIK